MSRLNRALLSLLIAGSFIYSATADELSDKQLRSLDGQVQEIKSDVLAIASELSNLEERLLYPSGTQIAIFVSVPADDAFRLDAVMIHIDGEPATHHIYSFKELEALQTGGVQRLYSGNVPTGGHELSVTMSGKLKGGSEFAETGTFAFEKGVEPLALGLTLAGPGQGNNGIQIEEW
jgi:hypothetical protein